MRKAASILLLTTTLLAFVAPGLYFPIATCIHRVTMHRWLKTQSCEQLTKIDLTVQQAKAMLIENEDEFDFNGKRYDIIKTKHYGNAVTVYCVNDQEEETLYAKASGASQNKNHQLQIIKSVSLVLYALSGSHEIIPLTQIVSIFHAAAPVNHYRNYSGEIISPPPQA